MKAILISGKICSGKSELAKAVVQAQYKEFIRLSLGSRIKQLAHGIAGYDNPKSSMRELYVAIGNTMRAVNGEAYWADYLYKYSGTYYPDKCMVIDDIRFPEEMQYYKSMFGIDALSVRLDVSPPYQAARHMSRHGTSLDLAEAGASTETALDDYHFDVRYDTDVLSTDAIAYSVAALARVPDRTPNPPA